MYASMSKLEQFRQTNPIPDPKPLVSKRKRVTLASTSPRVIPSGMINGPVGVYRTTALDQAASRTALLAHSPSLQIERVASETELTLLNTSIENPYPFLENLTKTKRQTKQKYQFDNCYAQANRLLMQPVIQLPQIRYAPQVRQ